MKRMLIFAVVGVVAAVIVLSLFALGFLSAPANNACPPQREACGSAVPFTVNVRGRVVNPAWSPSYPVIDAIVVTQGGPPAATFQVPKLDFWTNNFVITLNYCISYPSGNTYCAPGTWPTPPTQSGTVAGGTGAVWPGMTGWQYFLYHNGPKGSYTIQVTLGYQQTGCPLVTCSNVQTVTMGAGFSL